MPHTLIKQSKLSVLIAGVMFLILFSYSALAAVTISVTSPEDKTVGFGQSITISSVVISEGVATDFANGYNTIYLAAPSGFVFSAIPVPSEEGNDIKGFGEISTGSSTASIVFRVDFTVNEDGSNDATLDEITLTGIELTPISDFDPDSYDYKGDLVVRYYALATATGNTYIEEESDELSMEIPTITVDANSQICTDNDYVITCTISNAPVTIAAFRANDISLGDGEINYRMKYHYYNSSNDDYYNQNSSIVPTTGVWTVTIPKDEIDENFDVIELKFADWGDKDFCILKFLYFNASSYVDPDVIDFVDDEKEVTAVVYEGTIALTNYIDNANVCEFSMDNEYENSNYLLYEDGIWYFKADVAGQGVHDIDVTLSNGVCITEDVLTITVNSDVITVKDVFCYEIDTYDSILVTISSFKAESGYGDVEFNSLTIKGNGGVLDEFSNRDVTSNPGYYTFYINPTELYDIAAIGSLADINIQIKVTANVSSIYGIYTEVTIADEVSKIAIPQNDGEILDYSPTYCQGADSLRLRSNNDINSISIYFVDSLATTTNETTSLVDSVYNTITTEQIDTVFWKSVLFVEDTAYYDNDTVVFVDTTWVGNDSIAIRYFLTEEVFDHYVYETITTVVVDDVIYSTDKDANPYLGFSNEEYYFKLDQFDGDSNTIVQLTLEYSDENTCPGSIDYYPVVHKLPEVDFIWDTVCEEPVQFNQITSAEDSVYVTVNGWEWYFDDGFNTSNFSDTSIFDIADGIHGGRTDGTYKDPTHYFDEPGEHVVILGVMSEVGCVNYDTDTMVVGKYPDPVFSFDGSLQSDTTFFINTSTAESYDTLNHILIAVTTAEGELFEDSVNITDGNFERYSYFPKEYGVYSLHFDVLTNNGCLSFQDTIIPIYQYQYMDEDSSFFDGFTEAELQNGWLHPTDYDTSIHSGWTYGEISGEFDDTDKHTSGYMWRTGNPDSLIDNEASYLESPCFDIKDLSFPMLSLDIYQSMEPGDDGAAVFYTIDDGDSWERLGGKNTGGANWYEASGINKSPGSTFTENGGAHGWSKDTTAWVVSRYALDNVQEDLDTNDEHSCVRFRIAYNSNDAHDDEYQGFAVDNFAVAKRKRVVLIEEFINAEYEANNSSDTWKTNLTWLNTFVDAHEKEVCDIRYHIETSPYSDDLNYLNIFDNSARASSYGASAWGPMWVMDGVLQTKEFYKKVIEIDYATAMDERSLVDPSWDITIEDISQQGDSLKITTSITKIDTHTDETLGAHDVKVRYAIVQKEFTDKSGVVHRNVLLELLPNGIGNVVKTIAADEQVLNEPLEVTDYWLPTVATEGQEFRLIAYVQARFNYNEIEQVVFVDIEEFVPGFNSVQEIEYTETGFTVYPNPVSSQLNILNNAEFNSSAVSWNIYSVNGQVVKQGDINFLNNSSSIDVSALREGIYVLQLIKANGNSESVRFSKISY